MEIEIAAGLERIDLPKVYAWLKDTHWSPGITFEQVERAAKFSSLVVGAYDGDEQVGYLRVVSDRSRFAWVCDVYVAESHRKRGIAKAMMRFALADPEHQGLRRWVLATKDAHGVYAECGFEPLREPEWWMIRLDPNQAPC